MSSYSSSPFLADCRWTWVPQKPRCDLGREAAFQRAQLVGNDAWDFPAGWAAPAERLQLFCGISLGCTLECPALPWASFLLPVSVTGTWLTFTCWHKALLCIIKSAFAMELSVGWWTRRTCSSSMRGLMLLVCFSCGFMFPSALPPRWGVEIVCFFKWHIMIIESRDKI